MLQVTGIVAGTSIKNMLMGAILYVQNYEIAFSGGDLVHRGRFDWGSPPGREMYVWNANNHQTTYEMLGATVCAIYNYMHENWFGTASFALFDGENQVGAGEIR